MKIRVFEMLKGLLLALALLIPTQVFAQDDTRVFTSIDIQDDPIVVGVDTTFDVDISWATIGAWSYTEVYLSDGTLYGCFDTPNVAGGTSGTTTVSLPVLAALGTAGDYTLFMFQANNATCNDAGNTAAVLVCLITGGFLPTCPNDGLTAINEATVTVTKTFSDDNPAQVPISLECTDPDAEITVMVGSADISVPAEFIVSAYVDGTTCTASEAGVPAGYTSDNTSCVDLDLTSGEDSPCTIDNQQDPVTVTITKEYQGSTHPNGNPEVEITLTCPTATVTTSPATTSSLTVDFEVSDFPYDGEDCVATETVPAGWVDVSDTSCDALTVIPGGTPPTCEVANRPTFANFSVNKNFSDSNPNLAAVVTPTCVDDGAGPGIVYGTTSGNAFHGTNFNTTVEFFSGATNCTATEVDLVGYTEDLAQSTCDEGGAITDAADGSCIIFNQQDPVTILASKEYSEGSGPTVTFAATCDVGTVTTISADASVGTPAEFEVSAFPYNGASCDVTEPTPPPGYLQVGTTCAGLGIVPSDSDTLCTITNQLLGAHATFAVTKSFTDDDNGGPENPTSVAVTLSCFTGLPLVQTQSIDQSQTVTFVVESFEAGELDCNVSEDSDAAELTGYVPSYTAGGTPGGTADADGCHFVDQPADAENTCDIVNDAAPVPVEIVKDWITDGSGGDQVTQYFELTLYCDAEIVGGEGGTIKNGYGGCNSFPVLTAGNHAIQSEWCLELQGNGDSTFTPEVIPEWPASHCWVDETVYDDAVEVENGCGDINVSHGEGDSCLITNTVFYEGIPTLSQYGMVIMALLMLGVGLVGFRRLV